MSASGTGSSQILGAEDTLTRRRLRHDGVDPIAHLLSVLPNHLNETVSRRISARSLVFDCTGRALNGRIH